MITLLLCDKISVEYKTNPVFRGKMFERSESAMKKNIIFPLILASSSALAIFAAKEKKASDGNSEGAVDYLLILGCRVKGDQAQPTLQMRMEKAAQYLLENRQAVAVCCGGIVHEDQTKSEAQVIAEYLEKRGIEKERIIIEDKSQTTQENFINAKKLVSGLGTERSAALLSSEFHLLRAAYIAKKQGLELKTVSAPSPENERVKNYIRELLVFPAAVFQK